MLIACAFAVQSAAVEPQQQALAEEAPVLSPGSINPEEAPIHARSKKYAGQLLLNHLSFSFPHI